MMSVTSSPLFDHRTGLSDRTQKEHAATHRLDRDTSCMKAHVVKFDVFLSLFFPLAVFRQGRGWRNCFENRNFAFFLPGVLSFVFGGLVMLFVMNHIFAVRSGMSLC